MQIAKGALLVAMASCLVVACSKGQHGEPARGSADETSGGGHPVVVMKTNRGAIELELYPDKAPVTVENFLAYVDSGFYDGTVFHRVIPKFMIQGGGYDTKGRKKETREPIKNEANNGLKNRSGTVAMARTGVVDSATSQFFINVADNDFLDFTAPTPKGYGYAVFGRVVRGMDIVHTIETVPVTDRGGAFANSPSEPVVIESTRRK